MAELDDHQLLEEFVRGGSESAFAEIVARHVNLVHSTALRHTGHPQNAQEVTQAVFILLARKAARLSRATALSGWLYHAARLTSANLVRQETRRQRREQEVFMLGNLDEQENSTGAWERIAPLLDEAMDSLGRSDRDALVLRYFENMAAAKVASALSVTEAAAYKRVERALEKLRRYFSKRGVALSGTAIAAAVSAHSVQAAPAGLAAMIPVMAAKGSGLALSTLALAREISHRMALAAAKSAACSLGAAAGVVAVTCVTVLHLWAGPPGQWNLRGPLPQGNDLNAVTFGNGLFVAVGGGAIVHSTDGTNWTNPGFLPGAYLDSIAYGGGRFVAVGGGNQWNGPGVIATSTDGTNWSRLVVSTNEGFDSVVYGGGKFVATGLTGGVWTSTGGNQWARSVIPGNLREHRALAYGQGQFVSVGIGHIHHSPDGVDWQEAQSPPSRDAPIGVGYGNGTFIAVGQGPPGALILASSNGVGWTAVATPPLGASLRAITYGRGQFVAVGSGREAPPGFRRASGAVATSPDGVTWTSQTTNLPSSGLLGAAYGNGVFVAVGENSIVTSSDGVKWAKVTGAAAGDLHGVAVGRGLFVAVGDAGTVQTSPDGVRWTAGALGATNSLQAVAYGGGVFVTVGRTPAYRAVVLTSEDGHRWHQSSSGVIPALHGVAYGNGLFVAVGGQYSAAGMGTIVASRDGTNWATATSSASDLAGVAFGDGLFVAVGAGSFDGSRPAQIMTSGDGTNWTARLSGARDFTGQNARFQGVGHGYGVFVAVGQNGLLYSSLNGTTWTRGAAPVVGGNTAVAYGPGGFFVVGTSLTSTTGTSWSAWNPGTEQTLLGIAYGNGSFVAVGGRGTIIQSSRTGLGAAFGLAQQF